MKKRFVLPLRTCLSFLFFAIAAPTAFSDEPVATSPRWEGYYAGVQGGYGWGENNYTYTLGAETTDFNVDGVVGGGSVGANWQLGNFVLGFEGDFSISGIDGYENTSNDPNPTTPCLLVGSTEGCSADVNWFATLRARAGMAVGDYLPFITGGLAIAKTEGFADTGACGGPVCRYDDTEFGWTIGGGLEVLLQDGWSGKIEYLYLDLGEPTFTAPTVQADSIDFSVVRAGLNYRF